MLRVLVNKKFVATHVMMSIGNFREFAALTSYEMDENDWERFLLRDASMFFLVVLQETLASYQRSFELSPLVGELLTQPKTSRLFKVFAQFFGDSSQTFLEEFSYCALFYVAMLQTSKYQWKRWSLYGELPDGCLEALLSDDCADPDAVRLRAAVVNRLTLTNCFNTLFLKRKIESLAADELKAERRRFEFTLCVLEPDSSDHYKSLFRTLAACGNDLHADRLKVWLARRNHYDPRLDSIDWDNVDGGGRGGDDDDDGQWESVDEDDELAAKPNYIIRWNMVANRIAQRRFAEAINLLEKIDTLSESHEDKERRQTIWAYAATQSSDRDLLKRGQRCLADVAKNRPIANYWLAEMSFRLSAYAQARE